MKKTEFLNELKGKSVADLDKQARTIAEELMKLRFRKVTGQVEQSHRIRELRRNLARLQTVLTRERTAQQAKS
jgi:large subunit ribosomal protein L29